MRSLCSVLLIVGLLGAFAAHAGPTTLTGTVTKVRDGDTIEVGKIPIRLNVSVKSRPTVTPLYATIKSLI